MQDIPVINKILNPLDPGIKKLKFKDENDG